VSGLKCLYLIADAAVAGAASQDSFLAE
jgi:hypothetical protein